MRSVDISGDEMEQEVDYEQVEEILADADCETSAAELQAMLCGLLAAGVDAKNNSWLSTVAPLIAGDQPLTEAVKTLSKQLFGWSSSQISQQDALAPMLLPDDSYPAIDQLEALAEWCEGFLLGFGLQTSNQTIDNHEVREALTDIAEISQLDSNAEENDETQSALFTLVEHIKVAVQVIYWEMVMKQVNVGGDTTPQRTLH